ncbi:SDR family oxidoreductase [Streptomyces alanosinicus]|uniref:Thioester reductase (TE) domain-containing protein n=1 Tax=Streptomyces alanosinicus TaxID=68171 RepID=A0A918YTU8_9ACTN|nr:SDR family oxidoreductase [Streptomyces alanosinicus]GHE15886.1 hypothetical protein GCM10010339_91980 [Streptomyces alanosinicus]
MHRAGGQAHLVTGATGLIGAAVVLQLLTDTDSDIWCLTRPRGARAARQRLHQELTRAARLYGMADTADAIARRCHALTGNLDRPLDPGTLTALPEISHIWHSGASLRAEELFADQVREVNVEGTRRLLDLCRGLGAHFNYVSTASVAPRREGLQHEAPPDATSVLHNVYERSKREAELLVMNSPTPWRILRPVMVVGHSHTYAATTFSGLYAFARRLHRFRRAYGAALEDRRPALVGAATAEVHFAPVDQVARNAVHVGLHGATGYFYHLANSRTLNVADLYTTVFRWSGLLPPHCVPAGTPLAGPDRELNRHMAGFTDYFSRRERFDCTRTQAVVGPQAMSMPMDTTTLTALLDWYGQQVSRSRSPA